MFQCFNIINAAIVPQPPVITLSELGFGEIKEIYEMGMPNLLNLQNLISLS